MLNALLNQIETQLLSKKFLLATLLPLFLFLFGNGWMIWLHYLPFRAWIDKIDNLKDVSILATVLNDADSRLGVCVFCIDRDAARISRGEERTSVMVRRPALSLRASKVAIHKKRI